MHNYSITSTSLMRPALLWHADASPPLMFLGVDNTLAQESGPLAHCRVRFSLQSKIKFCGAFFHLPSKVFQTFRPLFLRSTVGLIRFRSLTLAAAYIARLTPSHAECVSYAFVFLSSFAAVAVFCRTLLTSYSMLLPWYRLKER